MPFLRQMLARILLPQAKRHLSWLSWIRILKLPFSLGQIRSIHSLSFLLYKMGLLARQLPPTA